MRKLISLTHLTLDGILQAPGGAQEDPSGGFTHGGWSMRFIDDGAGDVLRKLMASEFELLLGRRTYEIFAAYWPYAGDNFIAKPFNRTRKHVVTRTLDHFEWANSQPIRPDVVDGIRRLKATNGPDLHTWGSGELMQTLIAADLVDEFRLFVYPVLLGKGKRLFETGVPSRALQLAESIRLSSGVLINTYRPAGALPPPQENPETPSAAELARRRKLATEQS